MTARSAAGRGAALAALAALALGCRGDRGPGPAGPPRPSLRITVAWPGALPSELDREVTPLLEDAVAGLPGVTALRSEAQHERATVELTGAVDPAAVERALGPVLSSLPATAAPPRVDRLDPRATVVLVAAGGPRGDAAEAGERLSAIERSPGLRVRARCGGAADELVVTVDPAELAARGLSPTDVAQRLAAGLDDGGRGRALGVRAHRDRLAALAALEVRGDGGAPVPLGEVATLATEAAAGCQATVDGVAAALAEVERAPRATLPPGLRVLDGPTVRGTLLVEADDLARVLPAIHAAIATPRWFATRYDAELGVLQVAIGVAGPADGPDVATAIDHAAAAMAYVPPGRWEGAGLTVATAIVRGPEVPTRAPRMAAALRTAPGVAAAGCDPCASHPTQSIHFHATRLAAIGARAADLEQLIAIGRGGLAIDGDPVIRLTTPPDADVAALLLRTEQAGLIPIGELLVIEDHEVPRGFLRVDRQPAVELWARGGPGTSMAQLQKTLAAQSR